ncbi:hypothetical protein [Rhodopila sp.]|uniref:hypothetical protein n=1 Tax=Rhodopila sp. TaxID=2480087 RepID=UPI003D0E36C4
MLQRPPWQLNSKRLPPDHPLGRRDLGFVFLEQVSRLHILTQRPNLELANPDPDQLPENVVALGQCVQGFTGDELLGNLTLECDAMGTMLGDGFYSPESRQGGQIYELRLHTRRAALQNRVLFLPRRKTTPLLGQAGNLKSHSGQSTTTRGRKPCKQTM